MVEKRKKADRRAKADPRQLKKDELEKRRDKLQRLIDKLDAKIEEKIEDDSKRYRIQGGGTEREEEAYELRELAQMRSDYLEELREVEALLKTFGPGFKRIVTKLGRL